MDVCCEYDLKQSGVEDWMDSFLKAGERGLKARSPDEQQVHEREVKDLQAKVGELVLELDARKNVWSAPFLQPLFTGRGLPLAQMYSASSLEQ